MDVKSLSTKQTSDIRLPQQDNYAKLTKFYWWTFSIKKQNKIRYVKTNVRKMEIRSSSGQNRKKSRVHQFPRLRNFYQVSFPHRAFPPFFSLYWCYWPKTEFHLPWYLQYRQFSITSVYSFSSPFNASTPTKNSPVKQEEVWKYWFRPVNQKPVPDHVMTGAQTFPVLVWASWPCFPSTQPWLPGWLVMSADCLPPHAESATTATKHR